MNIPIANTSRRIAFLFCLILVLRIPGFYQPILDIDESVFGEFANIILDGGTPYVDAVDNKPPLTYYAAALAFLIFGKNNLIGLHIAATVVLMLTAWFIFKTTSLLSDENTGLIASAIFALLSHTYEPKYMSTSGELLVNLPLSIAMFLYIRDLGRPRIRTGMALCTGLLVGTAVLTNYKAGVALPVFLASAILTIWRVNSAQRKITAINQTISIALIGIGSILPLALLLCIFYRLGNLPQFIQWGFLSNFDYIASGSAAVPWYKTAGRFGYFIFCSLPVWLALAAYIKQQARSFDQPRVLIWLWLAVSAYAAAMGGRGYGHYFVQLLPPLSIMGAIAFSKIIQQRRYQMLFWGHLILLSAIFFASVIDIEATYRMVNYPNWRADRDYRAVGAYVRSRTNPRQTIYAWGFGAPIYHYADRRCGTRFLISDFISGRVFGTPNDSAYIHPLADRAAWNDFIADLHRKKPVYFIDTSPADHFGYKRFPPQQYPDLRVILKQQYRKETTIRGIDLYRRIR